MPILMTIVRFLGQTVPVPIWLLVLPAAVVLAMFTDDMRQRTKYADEVAARAKDVATASQEALDASERYRALEHQSQEAIGLIQQELARESEHADELQKRIAAGLGDGSLRVRSRFTCPPAPVVPGSPAAAAGGDAASEGGLRPADAEFLVRLAGEADDAVRALGACQATVRSYLQMNKDSANGPRPR